MAKDLEDGREFGRDGRIALLLSALTALALLIGLDVGFRLGGLEQLFAAESRHSALPVSLEAGRWGTDVAFLGDSRTLHGVRPDVVTRLAHDADVAPRGAENLGLSGLSPIGFLAITGHLLRRADPPKLVVFDLSPYMLSTLQSDTYAHEIRDFVFRVPDLPDAVAAGLPVEDALTVVTHELFHTVRFRRRVIEWALDWRAPGAALSLGDRGYQRAGRSTAQRQRLAAQQRALLGTSQVLGPAAAIDWTQLGYLRASVRRLHEAGIEMRFVTSPTSSPVRQYYRGDTLYGPAMRAYRRVAHSVGQTVYDDREVAPVEDWYFADGDHLSPEGATRHSAQLTQAVVLPALGVPETEVTRLSPARPSDGCEVVFDFEELHPTGWRLTGDAFSPLAVTGTRAGQAEVTGGVGYGLVNSDTAAQENRAVGTARSPEFVLSRPFMRLLVGGGDAETLDVRLLVDGQVVQHTRGDRSEHLREVQWRVATSVGHRAVLELVDRGRGAWQHLLLDQVELCDEARAPAPTPAPSAR